jgi:hypothetical protein
MLLSSEMFTPLEQQQNPDCQEEMKRNTRQMQMMMSFICSCRNKKEEPSSIYTLRKVRSIRGCLEGLTLMI